MGDECETELWFMLSFSDPPCVCAFRQHLIQPRHCQVILKSYNGQMLPKHYAERTVEYGSMAWTTPQRGSFTPRCHRPNVLAKAGVRRAALIFDTKWHSTYHISPVEVTIKRACGRSCGSVNSAKRKLLKIGIADSFSNALSRLERSSGPLKSSVSTVMLIRP